jgi:type II secretion system protein N
MTVEAATPNASARMVTWGRAAAAALRPGVERLASGERRPLLFYGLYTGMLFAVFLVATFPHDLLLQRALQSATAGTAFRVDAGGGRVGWALAYALDSLRLRTRAADVEPVLEAEALRFAPSWLGLLRGSPYPLGITATLYGGTLRGTIDPRPAGFRIDARLDDVDLARYTGLRPLVDGRLRGRLQAAVNLDGGGRGPAAAGGSIELRIPGLALESAKVRGITVPDLHFGEVHLTGTVKNGRLEIAELVANGEEVSVRGEGNVLLRAPLETSPLVVDLTVTPAPGIPDALRLAVNLLPGTSGEGGAKRIGIVGTLGRATVR